MILENQSLSLQDFATESFVTTKQLLKVLDNADEFKDDLIRVYNINIDKTDVFRVGNAKQLLVSINLLDSQCVKIDIESKIKDIQLKKLLDSEKALFEIFGITDKFILNENKSDLLIAETRYDAKQDVLDYYNFSKFANYCRDQDFADLVNVIKEYLKNKNLKNKDSRKLRLIYVNADKAFYLRAITSTSKQGYKNFGINFSVFAAIASLSQYVEASQNEVFISDYRVDDSNLYVSFALKNSVKVNSKLNMSLNLVLENDEIKRGAVSFNGVFKLTFADKSHTSAIYLKPKGIVKEGDSYPTDLLTFQHKGNVDTVFEKLKDLPNLIDFFIKQVSEDAQRISSIENPDDVRKLISNKIKYSKKPEFQVYKKSVFEKLMSINVDSTYKLFELLREVEELFEHQDVISKDFWRSKLYESLVERK